MKRIGAAVLQRAAPLLFTMAIGAATGHCQSVQLWPEADLSLTFKRTSVLIPLLSRLDLNLPNPQFVATGAVCRYRLNERWTGSVGYLFAELPQQNQTVHVPLAALTASWRTNRWTFFDVDRFERLMAYSNQPYRYRNRATADYAFGRSRARHLYISDEFFVNLSERSWNQNRAQAGLAIAVSRRVRLDLYGLERSAPDGKEGTAAGTVLTIVIGKRRG
jgi:hypothetical protein